jgi:biotin carboxyl carrier protein
VQAALEAVAAPRQGLVGQLFVAEGMAVAPGQPLFTLQPDLRLDQDLLDRALSRDIDNLDNRMRQAELRVLDLQDRVAQSRLEQQGVDPDGSAVAVAALATQERRQQQVLQRRRRLLGEGAVTEDDVDGTAIRLAEVTARLQDTRRQALQERLRTERTLELRRSLQKEQARLQALAHRLQGLRGQEETQRRLAADQPRTFSEARLRARSLYGTVRSSLRGVVVRILRDSGNPVRPRETVLILQRDQPPPVVVAQVPATVARQLRPGQRGEVEIPALRRRFVATVSALPSPRPDAPTQVQLTLQDPPAEELSRLAALRGAPAVVVLPNRANPLQLLPF